MRGAHTIRWYWNRLKTYVGRPRLVVQTKPVMIEDSNRCEEPVFIIGAHRSGTSLVRRLFNSHPEIACPPESFFMANYLDMLEDRQVLAGYDGFGYTADEMRADLARKASSLHEAFRIAVGKSIWADKTPEYSLRLDGIDRLFAGKPRYVIVLRHPGDVVHSIFRRGWRFNDIEDGFENALAHVKSCLDSIFDFEARHPDRCTRIVYCDLCDQPAQVLTAAMAKIGLEYDPEMLNFADKDHNFGLEDPVIRGTRKIDAKTGAWRSLDQHQQNRIAEVFGPQVNAKSYWGQN